ncbi:DUF4926 domain-containing protein [Phytoactinopolyspora endophytica]|uniref:DUF4926 domain-containing protein n=1 Tax=Phytoactinopolyspora endophytica TaxID=1642495 RepID=UPI00101BE0C5|nr:DUF4926 domain-containing protein [Phytoactinopolyspora endophytica]
MFTEHSLVVLRRDVPESGLLAGDVGSVIGVIDTVRYDVEFTTADGYTVATVNLASRDIRSGRAREILHVREIA